jgi:hypothetical protein
MRILISVNTSPHFNHKAVSSCELRNCHCEEPGLYLATKQSYKQGRK